MDCVLRACADMRAASILPPQTTWASSTPTTTRRVPPAQAMHSASLTFSARQVTGNTANKGELFLNGATGNEVVDNTAVRHAACCCVRLVMLVSARLTLGAHSGHTGLHRCVHVISLNVCVWLTSAR